MSGLLLGALGGLGQGLVNQAKHGFEEELKAMDERAQIEREKRIEEASIRAEGRHEQSAIRGEQRQAVNRRAQQQADLEFSTDPSNVGRMTAAELSKKKALDEYGDTRSPIEIQQAADRAAAIDRATYHDNTDYEGRGLAHDKARLEMADMRAEQSGLKLSKVDEKRIDFLKEKYKELSRSKANAQDEVERIDIDDDMADLENEIKSVFSKYDQGGGDKSKQGAEVDNDPLGIKRDMLVKKILAINPNVDLAETLSNSELQQILEHEKSQAKSEPGTQTVRAVQPEKRDRYVDNVNNAVSRARGMLESEANRGR